MRGLIILALGLAIAAGAERPSLHAASSCEFISVDRVVAIGDVHGAYDRFVEILRAAASEPTVRVVTYGDGPLDAAHIAAAACHFRALAGSCVYRAADVALDRVEDVSARRLAAQLAAVFDRVAR